MIVLVLHPLPIDPFCFDHQLELGEEDRAVPILVEEGQEPCVLTHLPALIDWSLTSCAEGGDVSLLGIDNQGDKLMEVAKEEDEVSGEGNA
jgi:hypothetical protein